MSPSEKAGETSETSRLQRWFQAVVTHPDGVELGADSDAARQLMALGPGQLEKVITRSRALTAAERLAIYANAYHTRLLECLGEIFPMLKRTLGDEAFDGLAFGYLQEYPSGSYTLNDLGMHFARYLEDTKPAAAEAGEEPESGEPVEDSLNPGDDWPDFMIDLARLEWVISVVFDGEGVEGRELLQSGQLHGIAPERLSDMRLKTVPCLQLLATRFPVNDFFTALRQVGEDEPVDLPAAARSFVAVTRRDFVVRRYNLSETEFELLQALRQREPLGRAIERAAAVTDQGVEPLAANLGRWFRNWTAEGFFESVDLGASDGGR